MRILALAAMVIALAGQPALAHHKSTHPDPADRASTPSRAEPAGPCRAGRHGPILASRPGTRTVAHRDCAVDGSSAATPDRERGDPSARARSELSS